MYKSIVVALTCGFVLGVTGCGTMEPVADGSREISLAMLQQGAADQGGRAISRMPEDDDGVDCFFKESEGHALCQGN